MMPIFFKMIDTLDFLNKLPLFEYLMISPFVAFIKVSRLNKFIFLCLIIFFVFSSCHFFHKINKKKIMNSSKLSNFNITLIFFTFILFMNIWIFFVFFKIYIENRCIDYFTIERVFLYFLLLIYFVSNHYEIHIKKVKGTKKVNEKPPSKLDNPVIINETEQNYKYVLSLFNILNDTDNEKKHISIALNGIWGIGKTSIIETLNEKIKEKYEIIYVNVWKFDKIDNLLIEVESLLQDFIEKYFFKIPKQYFMYFKHILKKSSSTFLDGFLDIFIDNIKDTECNKKNISEYIQIALESVKKKKIIFIFDDVDRINNKSEIFSILKTIKLLLDFKQCVTISVLDIDRINSIINANTLPSEINIENTIDIKENKQTTTNYYNFKTNDVNGFTYKIFNFVVDIPDITNQDNLVHFIRDDFKNNYKKELEDIITDNDKKEDIDYILSSIDELFKEDEIYNIFYSYREYKLSVVDFFNKIKLLANNNCLLKNMIDIKDIFYLSLLKNIDSSIYYQILSTIGYIEFSSNSFYSLFGKYDNEEYQKSIKKLLLEAKERFFGSQKERFIILSKRLGFDLSVDSHTDTNISAKTILLHYPAGLFYYNNSFSQYEIHQADVETHLNKNISTYDFLKNKIERMPKTISHFEFHATLNKYVKIIQHNRASEKNIYFDLFKIIFKFIDKVSDKHIDSYIYLFGVCDFNNIELLKELIKFLSFKEDVLTKEIYDTALNSIVATLKESVLKKLKDCISEDYKESVIILIIILKLKKIIDSRQPTEKDMSFFNLFNKLHISDSTFKEDNIKTIFFELSASVLNFFNLKNDDYCKTIEIILENINLFRIKENFKNNELYYAMIDNITHIIMYEQITNTFIESIYTKYIELTKDLELRYVRLDNYLNEITTFKDIFEKNENIVYVSKLREAIEKYLTNLKPIKALEIPNPVDAYNSLMKK
ncbi:MAG: hypothetical protein A2355_09925 [Spirochaetes bacterium RIFOXYB1_FULL_32_8]|nr:MAG: hypothetical protein A2Y30_15235 [Spirochaetes bacterium GWE1_32_154]OHD50304.1 MAG: hypothetical protein A2Y29_13285 [Spirochaetes bacterium GWE2_31_10]OHD77456.1 MAG: hypothetical protein A2355_09925 [Spirochaetes bacterium RIFOXYB1_FULL_32_8]